MTTFSSIRLHIYSLSEILLGALDPRPAEAMRGRDDVRFRHDRARAVDARPSRGVDVRRPRPVHVDDVAVDDAVDVGGGLHLGGVGREEAAIGVVLEGRRQGQEAGKDETLIYCR